MYKYLLMMLVILISAVGLLMFPKEHAEADDANKWKNGEVLSTLEALEWEAFSEAVSLMVEQYDGIVQVDDASELYRSGRLIVKANGDIPDLLGFDPVMVIRDEENHYLMQFLSSREAQACAEYLNAFQQIEYVEPDQVTSLNDVEGKNNEVQTEGLSPGVPSLP